MKADWIETTEHSITPEAVKGSATHILPSGTVVIASRVGLGKICRVTNDTAINQDLRGFTPKRKSQLDTQYLFWWFKSVADKIVAAGNGATVQGVTLPFLRSLEIPVPPLDEQQRIVAVLDKAFAGIATATANAQKKLSNAWELFESYLESVMLEAQNGSDIRCLREVCTFENGDRGENYPGRESFVQHGVPVINAGHLDSAGIDAAAMNFITREHFHTLKSGKVRLGDILFCLRGSLGKFAVNDIYDEAAIASSLVIIRPNETIKTKFLSAYLRSRMCNSMISKYRNGTAQPNLGGKSLELFLIPVPSPEIQETLVRRIEGVSTMVSNLTNNISRELSALTELKQSLLQKAFAGELT